MKGAFECRVLGFCGCCVVLIIHSPLCYPLAPLCWQGCYCHANMSGIFRLRTVLLKWGGYKILTPFIFVNLMNLLQFKLRVLWISISHPTDFPSWSVHTFFFIVIEAKSAKTVAVTPPSTHPENEVSLLSPGTGSIQDVHLGQAVFSSHSCRVLPCWGPPAHLLRQTNSSHLSEDKWAHSSGGSHWQTGGQVQY